MHSWKYLKIQKYSFRWIFRTQYIRKLVSMDRSLIFVNQKIQISISQKEIKITAGRNILTDKEIHPILGSSYISNEWNERLLWLRFFNYTHKKKKNVNLHKQPRPTYRSIPFSSSFLFFNFFFTRRKQRDRNIRWAYETVAMIRRKLKLNTHRWFASYKSWWEYRDVIARQIPLEMKSPSEWYACIKKS